MIRAHPKSSLDQRSHHWRYPLMCGAALSHIHGGRASCRPWRGQPATIIMLRPLMGGRMSLPARENSVRQTDARQQLARECEQDIFTIRKLYVRFAVDCSIYHIRRGWGSHLAAPGCVPVGTGCTHWPSLACGSPPCTQRLPTYCTMGAAAEGATCGPSAARCTTRARRAVWAHVGVCWR